MRFDFIAPYYDFISKLVFVDVLEKSKVSQFSNISKGSKVLFVGGGSGSSLNMLLKTSSNLEIDFVEPSQKMISIAKGRIGSTSCVNFHQIGIENFNGSSYDVIITEFFFDLFDKESIQLLIKGIGSKLNTNGKWIDTDFRIPQGRINKIILTVMYLFFKITAGVVIQKLTSTKNLFSRAGFEIGNEKKFRDGFISSRLILRP